MANPVKAAKQIFDQFLSKVDPANQVGCVADVAEPDYHELAAKGGNARAKSLTPRRRRQIAKQAAKKRWSK